LEKGIYFADCVHVHFVLLTYINIYGFAGSKHKIMEHSRVHESTAEYNYEWQAMFKEMDTAQQYLRLSLQYFWPARPLHKLYRQPCAKSSGKKLLRGP
jgi:hypothetical protein